MKYLKPFSMNESIEITKPIKQSEITAQMFEAWKDEMREIFKDRESDMNLINLCLKWLDKTDESDKIESYNKRLLEFYENELARNGQLLCDNCSQPMEVYYTVKCFKCEAGKPKIEDSEGNLIECGRWLENQEEDFIFDDFWDALVGRDLIQGNDTYIKLSDSNTGEYGRLISIWKKHFPLNTKWEVSW